MNRTTTSLWLALAAALVMSTAAVGADQLVPGSRLSLKVGNNGREKLSFKSKGSFTIPVPGSADDPSQHGATLQIVNPGTSESFTFSLPQTHWSMTPSGSLYKYRDSALAEAGKVKIAIIKGRQLKVSGKKVGITLDESSQGALAVVLTSGTIRYCARFDDGSVRRDAPGSFSAKGAPPPGACPAPSSTTTTTPGGSTTTVSLPLTTTTTSPGATTTTISLPLTTTTITLPVTTTTGAPGTSTTTIVIGSTTTSTVVAGSTTTTLPPMSLVFTTTAGTTDCGPAGLTTAPATPVSGELDSDTGGTTKIVDLGLGCLYVGGGGATIIPPGPIPAGAASYFDIQGSNLVASNGTGTLDCTKGAGPGTHCINGNAGTGGGACSSDLNCGGSAGSCGLDPNCFFGPPLEFLSPAPFGALTTCAVNVVQTDASGTGDPTLGTSTVTLPISSRVYITGNTSSPCPRCVSGLCTYGQRQGLACTTTSSSLTSQDCPPTLSGFQAPLPVALNPLTTGSASLTDSAGNFCPSQRTAGAFGQTTARRIFEQGIPGGDLTDGLPHAASLGSAFCIPPTNNVAVDGVADLPGPGGTSLNGNAQIVPTP